MPEDRFVEPADIPETVADIPVGLAEAVIPFAGHFVVPADDFVAWEKSIMLLADTFVALAEASDSSAEDLVSPEMEYGQ